MGNEIKIDLKMSRAPRTKDELAHLMHGVMVGMAEEAEGKGNA